MHKLVVVITFAVMSILLNYQIKRVDSQQKEMQINLSFSGIVLEKTHHRGYGITILTNNEEKFEIAIASDYLYNHVVKGDTIIKMASSNRCLVKGDTNYQCDCYYFIADNE